MNLSFLGLEMNKILVIEDHQDLSRLLSMHLSFLNAFVNVVDSGATGLTLALNDFYHLIILDLQLPDIDGLEVCKRLREESIFTPILMLTKRTSELDRVMGLNAGADDYLPKPFNIKELVARAKALLRRMEYVTEHHYPSNSISQIRIGELRINIQMRQIFLRKKLIDVTSKEFDLLLHFATHPGQVFSRTQLLNSVWGYDFDGYEHTVNSHINRLRSKIEDTPSNPRFIVTVWGVGYKLDKIIYS